MPLPPLSCRRSKPQRRAAHFDSDLQVHPPFGLRGGSTIYRLREGIEHFMITDINNPAASAQAQSTIIVAFDVVNEEPSSSGVGFAMNHVPGGANTLYMDGHAEFVQYVPTGKPPRECDHGANTVWCQRTWQRPVIPRYMTR